VGTEKSGEVERRVGVRRWSFPLHWSSRGSDCRLSSGNAARKSVCFEIVSATIPDLGTLSKSPRGL
jgi:hypothetical protein